ncbi:MAG: hypothetical protein HY819_06035 [Acidobacteria bacterium]|nr:hypothetical protein [Acidobacteriota bacterium]
MPVIGIDEIALKKGHKDYVAIISTMGEQGVEISVLLNINLFRTTFVYLDCKKTS